MKRKHVGWAVVLLIIGIFAFNALALQLFLYWRIRWLDIPMHFFGGLWLGLVALWSYYLSGRFTHIPLSHRTLTHVFMTSILSALIFGTMWELYELALDTFVRSSNIYSIRDTMGDLFFDLVGGCVAASIFIKGKFYQEEQLS